MLKLGAVIILFGLLFGVYNLGYNSGENACKASAALAKEKAIKESQAKANEILQLKKELRKKTITTIVKIRKIKDVTNCLDTPLNDVGLGFLLR